MSEPDPYALLGVATTATAREIAAAFRRRVRQLHPDAPDGDGDRFAAVVAAYDLLRDPRRRAEFDRRRGRGIPVPVRRHPGRATPAEPDLRAGPVRHHRR
ncbi:J domain-containing protein [Amycolatopsis sp. NPDC051128]|uniref:J domain-containing protein n=1 Tax=Amycolatopsis sp. NPDC051128 TaxID=3155412 RepID=UPI0034422DB4